jgi:hypothetical protein
MGWFGRADDCLVLIQYLALPPVLAIPVRS